MGTTQSSVARLESGSSLPSLRSLKRYAYATGSKIRIVLDSWNHQRHRRIQENPGRTDRPRPGL